jgi:hypothetical protein
MHSDTTVLEFLASTKKGHYLIMAFSFIYLFFNLWILLILYCSKSHFDKNSFVEV